MAAVENGVVNGNGLTNGSRPSTPSLNTLSLTEYSTNPSPPRASPRSKIRDLIPDEFILPNGYPDVFSLSLLE
jgi:threonine dehydratase